MMYRKNKEFTIGKSRHKLENNQPLSILINQGLVKRAEPGMPFTLRNLSSPKSQNSLPNESKLKTPNSLPIESSLKTHFRFVKRETNRG